MRAVFAVFKRELALYFRSPIAYVVAIALLFFTGALNTLVIVQSNQQFPADATFSPGILTFLTFLTAPLLTMRLIAEENREGTVELLMTLPMNEAAFIVGKFLAAWTYYTVILILTLVHYAILYFVGVPDSGAALGAYLGAWLYGGAVLAVTMIWSAVTEDQIVAAFLGAATVLILYVADTLAAVLSSQPALSGLSGLVRELALQPHYAATMARGIIRVEDIAYFIFMIVAALFITTRIVEVRRWRA